MGKRRIGLIVALSAFVPVLISGNAAAQGDFCLLLTSDVLGVDHSVGLNYSEVKNGIALVSGKSCYTIVIPGGNPVTDCAPVTGTAIIQEGRIPGTLDRTPMLEIALNATEHHELFEHAITTTSGTHIWIQDLDALTGTWAAQSHTSVEGVVQGLFQLDAGTVAAATCPAEGNASQNLLKDTLKNLRKE